jgi:hypothetical protein
LYALSQLGDFDRKRLIGQLFDPRFEGIDPLHQRLQGFELTLVAGTKYFFNNIKHELLRTKTRRVKASGIEIKDALLDGTNNYNRAIGTNMPAADTVNLNISKRQTAPCTVSAQGRRQATRCQGRHHRQNACAYLDAAIATSAISICYN